MTKLIKLIELNKLEKLNRKNRLKDTLRAINWQNRQLDKQIKMIEQTRNKAIMMSNEALMKPDKTTKETQNIAPVYVDTKTAKFLHDMGAQTNPQLK